MEDFSKEINFEEIYQSSNNLDRFCEMSNFYKNQTGLPVNIWVDAAQEYKKGKHAKRIKFQLNTGKNIGGQATCPMMLNGEIPKNLITKIEKIKEISANEINQVRNFVINNAYALEMAADEKIHDSDFGKVMIKGGEPASDAQKNQLKIEVNKIIASYED